jgi:CheY-like chemotaxis protein
MGRILIVDGNKPFADTTRFLLRKLGHVTERLPSSSHFGAAFADFRPDIVMLDMLMPEVRGVAILQWLTEVGYTGGVVLISTDPGISEPAMRLVQTQSRMKISTLFQPSRLADLELAVATAGQCPGLRSVPKSDRSMNIIARSARPCTASPTKPAA